MAKQINWIPEAEAARKIRRHPRVLRRLVKSGTLNISYTTINGRSYQYSEGDIERMMVQAARIVHHL